MKTTTKRQPKLMKKTYALSRVSTINQSSEFGGTGIDFQNEKLKQYADLQDFNLIKIIEDVASGGLNTREGIEELKQHITDGNVEVVLIWNVSRAFRSMIHFTKFYEFLKNHNVELISVSEGIRSSRKEGEMMFGIMCSIAGYEKNLITERMVSGRITKASKGINVGKLPYGYIKNTDGEIVVNTEESKVVKYIFKKVNQLQKSKRFSGSKCKRTRHLIKLLTEKGYSFRGKRFSGGNIRCITTNEWYVGVYKYSDITTKHSYPTLVSKRLFNSVYQG